MPPHEFTRQKQLAISTPTSQEVMDCTRLNPGITLITKYLETFQNKDILLERYCNYFVENEFETKKF